jgi:hypothetical protein
MTAFQAAQTITAQGAKKHGMALVLESLHNEKLLPVWGEGETGADLTSRDVVSIILGATSPQPEEAAAHCVEVASLIRTDGLSFGEVLTKTMLKPAHEIAIEELAVSSDGQTATIRYTDGKFEIYSTGNGQAAFRHAVIIRGSLLQALAIKMQTPTVSGWSENPVAE